MYFRLQLEDQSVYPQQVTKHQWDTFVDATHINYIANNSKLILKNKPELSLQIQHHMIQVWHFERAGPNLQAKVVQGIQDDVDR